MLIFTRPFAVNIYAALLSFNGFVFSQNLPVADFSVSPNPVCSGSVIQISDLSTGSPTAWSYTVSGPTTTFTVQNPSLQVSGSGIKSVTLVVTNNSGNSVPVVKTFTVLSPPATVINPSFAITCPGAAPITLTVNNPGNAAYTYSWSTGATTGSISVSPPTTTVYSCLVTNTAGCSALLTKTVTSAFPVVSIAASPLTICQNGASTLTAGGTGPSPVTYSWSTGVTTKTVVTNVPGAYSVTFTAGNGCAGTQSVMLQSSSTLSLPVQSSPSVICLGSPALLSVSGAATYSWSTGATASLTGVSPNATTVYTVWGSAGTCTGTAAVTVSVNTTPTLVPASSAVEVCEGDSTIVSVTGAANYTWSTGALTASAGVFPGTSTIYTVTGQNAPCAAVTETVLVIVNPNPTVQISSSKTVACINDKVTLTAGGASTYTWNSGPAGNTYTFTAAATGTYMVTGLDVNGCYAYAQFTQSVVPCTALKEQLPDARLKIFPNPGAEPVISAQAKLSCVILSAEGRVLYTIGLDRGESLAVPGLAPGLYFLKAEEGSLQYVRRFIVTR